MPSIQKRILFLITVSVLLTAAIYTALAAGSTSLTVNPAVAIGPVGLATGVSIDLVSDQSVQGLDVEFSFDPAVLQVVDADPGTNGVQMTPGNCPAPDLVVINAADNGAGTAQYVAVEFVTNCSNGEVLEVAFTCLAEGSSAVTITAATISDPNGMTIDHEVFNGTVMCVGNQIFLPGIFREP